MWGGAWNIGLSSTGLLNVILENTYRISAVEKDVKAICKTKKVISCTDNMMMLTFLITNLAAMICLLRVLADLFRVKALSWHTKVIFSFHLTFVGDEHWLSLFTFLFLSVLERSFTCCKMHESKLLFLRLKFSAVYVHCLILFWVILFRSHRSPWLLWFFNHISIYFLIINLILVK